jgi:hypothetical protein
MIQKKKPRLSGQMTDSRTGAEKYTKEPGAICSQKIRNNSREHTHTR